MKRKIILRCRFVIVNGVYDVELEGFGVVFACHEALDDALEQVFVNAPSDCVKES